MTARIIPLFSVRLRRGQSVSDGLRHARLRAMADEHDARAARLERQAQEHREAASRLRAWASVALVEGLERSLSDG